MDVIKTTGPWFLTKKLFKNIDKAGKIVVLPLTYFYHTQILIKIKLKEMIIRNISQRKRSVYIYGILDGIKSIHLWGKDTKIS